MTGNAPPPKTELLRPHLSKRFARECAQPPLSATGLGNSRSRPGLFLSDEHRRRRLRQNPPPPQIQQGGGPRLAWRNNSMFSTVMATSIQAGQPYLMNGNNNLKEWGTAYPNTNPTREPARSTTPRSPTTCTPSLAHSRPLPSPGPTNRSPYIRFGIAGDPSSPLQTPGCVARMPCRGPAPA